MEHTLKEEENKMTNIKELAIERNGGIWVSSDFNRGWTSDEVTGDKLRMKKDEHEAKMEEQAQLIQEITAEQVEEQGQAEEATTAPIELDDTTMDLIQGADGTTDRLIRHVATARVQPKLITINCQRCGAERVIKVQDKFQVKYCKNCQKEHRNARRREIRRLKKEQGAN